MMLGDGGTPCSCVWALNLTAEACASLASLRRNGEIALHRLIGAVTKPASALGPSSKRLAIMLRMTAQTYFFCAGSLSGPEL